MTKEERKLELYKVAVGLHSQESQRYWERNTVFIILNGGLLALLGTDILSGEVDRIGVCIIGAFVSYIWHLMLRQGKDLIERWSEAARIIEKEFVDSERLYLIADEASEDGVSSFGLPLSKFSASQLMKVSSIFVGCAWCVALFAIWYWGGQAEDDESFIRFCVEVLGW